MMMVVVVVVVVVVAHTVVFTFVLYDSPSIQPPYLAMFVEQTISRHQHIFEKMKLLVLPLAGA
jgi:hypothetical protein